MPNSLCPNCYKPVQNRNRTFCDDVCYLEYEEKHKEENNV